MKKESPKETHSPDLDTYRQDIDEIDKQIVSMLSKRQELAQEIGRVKKELGIEIVDPAREQDVLKRLSSTGNKNLNPQVIRAIFSEVISAARSIQQSVAVAFLGPEATFSHQAAVSLYGRSASFRAAETIEEVFELVEKGVCQQGVVPIENSFEGSVNITLDLLYKYELKINAEIFLRIRHHLLSREKHLQNVKMLYSHPMPIAQCRSWIRSHLPGLPIKEVTSTSLAARMAADEPGTAAISSRFSGQTYGLNMLEQNIEDHPDNVTRFLAIGKTPSEPTGQDKTSILFFLRHKPGALHRGLAPLAERNVNMTRIESRPMKTRNWEYLFFVDLEGHEKDSNVNKALVKMERECVFFKRIGSYPSGGEPWD